MNRSLLRWMLLGKCPRKAKEHGALFIETSPKAGLNIKVSLFFHFSALFEKKLIKYLMNNMKSAAIVPQDRHIPSWTGRAFVSKA
jgi:hypothetical protein